jgi:hypothetical protein
MEAVGADRERAGAPDDVPLIGDQCCRQDQRGDRHADAELRVGGLRAAQQPLHCAEGDEDGRKADQDDLHQRSERFRFAVTEAMVVIGRRRRDPNAKEDDQAGHEIEAAVGERAEHCGGIGLIGRPGFERDQRN